MGRGKILQTVSWASIQQEAHSFFCITQIVNMSSITLSLHYKKTGCSCTKRKFIVIQCEEHFSNGTPVVWYTWELIKRSRQHKLWK